MKLLMKLRQSPMKDEYTKDPNKLIPDHEIDKDKKYAFIYKDETFKCDELGLECAAQGIQQIQIILPGGISFKTDSRSEHTFTSAHFFNKKELDYLKMKGVFDEVNIFGCK